MITIPGGVICCGNVVQDILVRPVDGVVFDTTTWVESIEYSLGGNGANTSYALAKLGAPARLVAFVGEDEAGKSVLAALARCGVDISRVSRVPNATTATTVGLVNRAGARAFLHNPGVSRQAFRGPFVLDEGLTEGCSHFHLGNPFSTIEMRRRAGEVLAEARRAGLTTSVDTGWDSLGEWMAVIGPCLAHLDLLFVNREEARLLSGHEEPAAAARFFIARGVGAVIVKAGAEGCLLFEKDGGMLVPAFEVKAVDSTGAGDCFAGAFMAGLHHGMGARDAARLGNAAGALSVSELGAVTGLLSLEQTLDWIKGV